MGQNVSAEAPNKKAKEERANVFDVHTVERFMSSVGETSADVLRAVLPEERNVHYVLDAESPVRNLSWFDAWKGSARSVFVVRAPEDLKELVQVPASLRSWANEDCEEEEEEADFGLIIFLDESGEYLPTLELFGNVLTRLCFVGTRDDIVVSRDAQEIVECHLPSSSYYAFINVSLYCKFGVYGSSLILEDVNLEDFGCGSVLARRCRFKKCKVTAAGNSVFDECRLDGCKWTHCDSICHTLDVVLGAEVVLRKCDLRVDTSAHDAHHLVRLEGPVSAQQGLSSDVLKLASGLAAYLGQGKDEIVQRLQGTSSALI